MWHRILNQIVKIKSSQTEIQQNIIVIKHKKQPKIEPWSDQQEQMIKNQAATKRIYATRQNKTQH